MPFSPFGSFPWGERAATRPAAMQGKRRGVTKSPARAKRKNRRKP
jgi:hypothetical protein